ncbi:MAG TPA: RHS repeat-associated core domain-containing protein [Pyrinomonadaceae bacterium]|nr:RHS repeat-associated core domain-containing protein [Pyrinomonadaceae bacterium]
MIFVYNAGGTLVAEYSAEIEGVETAQVSYLTQDHLGSPRVVTDKNGGVLSRKDYSAFGEELVADEHRSESEEYGGGEVRKGYTGYEKDSESGLEFAQARYYNTIHGRFTSVDPLTASASIRNPQTFNRYSYVLNSPYKFTDALGLIPSTTGACGSWCYWTGGGSMGLIGLYSDNGGPGIQLGWDQQRADPSHASLLHEMLHAVQTDDRPNIGGMLGENDAGWDPAPGYGYTPEGARRFGEGHDGEHRSSRGPGADIKAIAGLTGTVLQTFVQEPKFGLYTTMILLQKTNIVLILKDIVEPGPKILAALSTSTSFTDKSGNPTSKVEIGVGDLIGKTMPWTKGSGTFHFAFIKMEFAQRWRNELRAANNVNHTYTPALESRTEIRKGVRYLKDSTTGRASPMSWWIVPCGSASPVRC